MKSASAVLGLAVGLLGTFAQAAEPIKLGVYTRGVGGGAVLKALSGQPGIKATAVKTITTDAILPYDVFFVGAATLDQPGQLRAFRAFLACGGGIILNHSACGRWRPDTLFPAVARKVSDRREDTLLTAAAPAHPMVAGLPDHWEHAYYDHLCLEAGPEGTIVLKDRAGAAVAVAGNVGPGRLLLNGSLPGYRYDTATFAQAESEPTGAELQFVINAIRWAAEGRASALPAAERDARRQRVEQEMKMEDLSKLLPTSDWFGTEMLRGSYLPPRPVSELGGRFFITYDTMTWRGYDLRTVETPEELDYYRQRLKLDVLQLKWMGVTDIVYWTSVSGDRVYHDTSVPDCSVQVKGVDPLAELIRIATPEGMNVWASWHSCFRDKKLAEKFCGKDAEGKPYTYGTSDYVEDLLSPAYQARCRAFLDEYAAKYKPMGRFMGLAAYDELWFTYADFHGDDLPAMEKFFEERFGEKPPADLGARLAKGRLWNDANDVWRRRYMLFKQNTMTNFWRDLVDHAHRKGLQIGVQIGTASPHGAGWSWGFDGATLGRLPADFFNGSCTENAATSHPNILRWSHLGASWGLYNTHCLRGGPGGIFFTFNQFWRLVMYANNPKLVEEFSRHVHNQREWAGAEPLGRVGILSSDQALLMLLSDPRPQATRERALLDAVQRTQDADMTYTQWPDRYKAFRTLVAPPYALRGVPADTLAKLRAYIEGGGNVLSCHADWTTAREDFTDERPVTAEFVGVAYGKELPPEPAAFTLDGTEVSLPVGSARRETTLQPGTRVLATFANGAPAVTVRELGKGRVIGLHFDAAAELERGGVPAVAVCVDRLLRDMARPEITVEGTGSRVISTLKKGNWVAVALFPDQTPSALTLRADLKALGINQERFRVTMLGKRMEISRPGDLWGETGFWKAEELAKGFRVTVVADDDRNLPLPEQFDLSDFTGKKADQQRQYIETVTREWWDGQNRGKQKRNYAHEIVVFSPADEAVMPAHAGETRGGDGAGLR